MSMNAARYPLAWPFGYPRAKSRRSSQFKVTFDKALSELADEIDRLGGTDPILSTNIALRLDGQLRRDRIEPSDPGVAVYFTHKGKQKAFACDTYYTVRDNIRAIGKTIEALRSIERNGASHLLERALSAFDMLTAPGKSWWDVLECRPDATRTVIEANFRRLARDRHPDNGGTHEAMSALNEARDAALKAKAA